jgi:hypothetical protein
VLIGNYSLRNKSPARFMGGNSTAHASGICDGASGKTFGNWNLVTNWRKFCNPDRSGGSGSNNSYASLPNGSYPPVAYALPVKAGGISSHNYTKGESTFSGSGAMGLNAESVLDGVGEISISDGSMAINAISSISATGELFSDIFALISANANLTGYGDISSGTLNLVAQLVASLVGSGDILTSDIVGIVDAIANLSGSGLLNDPIIAGKLEAIANLTGSGDITTNDLLAVGNIVSSISGTGDLSSAIKAIANVVADLTGSGVIIGEASAKAFMSSDITVTGDLLSTANVADAIWGALAENYVDVETMGGILQILDQADGVETDLTIRQALRLISAALAGKISGAPGTTITIRDTTDSKDRIIATVDSNGNRTAITLDKD